MVNAIGAAHARNGPWAQKGGYEYPLVLLVVATGLAIAGPGAYSLDRALGIPVAGLAGAALAALAFVAGLATLSTRRPEPARQRRAA